MRVSTAVDTETQSRNHGFCVKRRWKVSVCSSHTTGTLASARLSMRVAETTAEAAWRRRWTEWTERSQQNPLGAVRLGNQESGAGVPGHLDTRTPGTPGIRCQVVPGVLVPGTPGSRCTRSCKPGQVVWAFWESKHRGHVMSKNYKETKHCKCFTQFYVRNVSGFLSGVNTQCN